MKGNFNRDPGHYSAKVGLTVSLWVEGGTKTCTRTHTHTHLHTYYVYWRTQPYVTYQRMVWNKSLLTHSVSLIHTYMLEMWYTVTHKIYSSTDLRYYYFTWVFLSMPIHTSTPLHLRGKYCTFYSICYIINIMIILHLFDSLSYFTN